MREDMNVNQVASYWQASAEEDWPVVRHLVDSGAYHYALFFGHLYLEKLLKALAVTATGEHAPRTHNLLYLAELAGLSLSEERREALLRITAYSVETRYPHDLAGTRHRYTREHTEKELGTIEEIGEWLKSLLNRVKP
jgi:HEPN domain-containing protein